MQRSSIYKSNDMSGTLKRIEDKIDLLVDKTKVKLQAIKHEEAVGSAK
jgi:hypothetical protein